MIWKTIPGFSRYEISEHGIVRRSLSNPMYGRGVIKKPGQVLKPFKGEAYLSLKLKSDYGYLETKRVHALVCLAFNGSPPDGKPCACHKDDNKRNNFYKNLSWESHSSNTQQAIANGKIRKGYKRETKWQLGEKGPNAILTQKDAAYIRANYVPGKVTLKMLASKFLVSEATISNVINLKSFKDDLKAGKSSKAAAKPAEKTKKGK